ncbi:MAG TPA: glycosyltransferase [Paenirhodobacter sp.]
MTEKTRLVAEIEAALALDRAAAEAALHRIAADPQAAQLGQMTALGVPRKIHSALVRLAKRSGDRVGLAGLRATAVPPEDLLGPLFVTDARARAAMVAAATMPVPRLVHQIWVGGPAPVACARWRTWAGAHGWSYRLWDLAALEQAGITADPVWQQMLVQGDLPGAVDVARYHILARMGGIYLDCDWFPARADLPPGAAIPALGLSVLAEPAPRCVAGASLMLSNALIAAPVAHPALIGLISALPEVARRLPGAPAWWVTGPLVFTLAVRSGPVTVLDAAMIAGALPRAAPLAAAEALAQQVRDGAGMLIAWKGW